MEFNAKSVDLLYRMVLQYNKSLVIDKYGVQVMSLEEGDNDDSIFLADTVEGMIQNLPYKTNSDVELQVSIEDLKLISPDFYYQFGISALKVEYEVALALGDHKAYDELNTALVEFNDLSNIEIDVDFGQDLEPSFEVIMPQEFAIPTQDGYWIMLMADEITGDALYTFYVDRGISGINDYTLYGSIIKKHFEHALKFEDDRYSLDDVVNAIVDELDEVIPQVINQESEEFSLRARAMADGKLFNVYGDLLNGNYDE